MAEVESQIREAAETLLNSSINSQRNSYTQQSLARTPDIILSEDLIAGARQDGRMSNVRRFFCLFVTFDLLLTILMWLICTMIAGENLETAFVKQVVHYNVSTSLFDIVMAAMCRFTVLLLFYALLYLNHWIIVAISTAATCAFLIAKVFLFDWSTCNQPVFQVLLIVASFILAWAEAWFFDFRVTPQETHARNWIRSVADTDRSPLLPSIVTDTRQYRSVEPISTFFTPVDSPAHSDNEEESGIRSEFRRSNRPTEGFSAKQFPQFTSEMLEDYKKKAASLLQICYDLLTSNEWKVEATTPDGDVVSYMTVPKEGGRIVRITGIVQAPARTLVDQLFEQIEASPEWNKLVTESTKLQRIDDNTDIVYQATSPQGGGIVGARDFVILRHRSKRGNYHISSGVSVPLASIPARKHVVRGENGVSCWAAEELPDYYSQCRFTWILNTNLKGWLPQKLVDKAMFTALINFMSYLRKHLDEMQRQST